MADSARLEIHVVNVGQGDSVLILNRDLNALRTNLANVNAAQVARLDDIDLLPWALKNSTDSLKGTVNQAMLIDGGEDVYGNDVVSYLEQQGVVEVGTPFCEKLSVLISHYHSDHISGLRYVFKEKKETTTMEEVWKWKGRGKNRTQVKEIVPVTTTEIVDRYRPAHIYFTEPDDKKDPSTVILEKLREDIDEAASRTQPTVKHGVPPGGARTVVTKQGNKAKTTTYEPVIISLGKGINDIPIELRVVAAACQVWDPTTNIFEKVDSKTVDQNDRTLVVVLEYGSFRAFLGGDIAGNGGKDAGGNGEYAMDAGAKKHFSLHGDVEGKLMPILEKVYPKTETPKAGEPKFKTAGHCTFYKASHHGSSSSTDIFTLSTLRPCLSALSSGFREHFYHHPTSEVLGRLGEATRWKVRGGKSTVDNTVRKGVYITEIAQKYKKKAFINPSDYFPPDGVRLVGDVIVRPIDESILAIHKATKFGTPLRVQVFGTGMQTHVEKPNTDPTTLRSCVPAKTDGIYPIAQRVHECNLH